MDAYEFDSTQIVRCGLDTFDLDRRPAHLLSILEDLSYRLASVLEDVRDGELDQAGWGLHEAESLLQDAWIEAVALAL